MATPQVGHVPAIVDTRFPHSGHFIMLMMVGVYVL